ncbi:MAG: hypothetical protein BWY76_00808 [bacterium ADurb.Bin429]|nr:MAG: hypothetical protein BWY76_00808 [bacterium ADurb.Bin429]
MGRPLVAAIFPVRGTGFENVDPVPPGFVPAHGVRVVGVGAHWRHFVQVALHQPFDAGIGPEFLLISARVYPVQQQAERERVVFVAVLVRVTVRPEVQPDALDILAPAGGVGGIGLQPQQVFGPRRHHITAIHRAVFQRVVDLREGVTHQAAQVGLHLVGISGALQQPLLQYPGLRGEAKADSFGTIGQFRVSDDTPGGLHALRGDSGIGVGAGEPVHLAVPEGEIQIHAGFGVRFRPVEPVIGVLLLGDKEALAGLQVVGFRHGAGAGDGRQRGARFRLAHDGVNIRGVFRFRRLSYAGRQQEEAQQANGTAQPRAHRCKSPLPSR